MSISDIVPQKKRKNRVSVFIDGKYGFSLDYDTFQRSNLHIGDDIDEREIENLLKKDEFPRVLDYSYTLLSLRERSEYELKKKLYEKEFPGEVVREVIDYLKKEKLLDDRIFAQKWVDYVLHNKPMGKIMVMHELKKKGIKKDIIDEVCSEKLPLEVELALAKRVLQKKLRTLKGYPEEVVKNRLFQFLKNRGFNFDTIQESLKGIDGDNIP